MHILSNSLRFFARGVLPRCNIRFYTKGAEKLFHKVDWNQAVGRVVVVDPFDPSSLLYLPASGYLDLIKTALANRSPLVVVHGLNDVVPSISTEVDGARKTDSGQAVQFRVFKLDDKEVHRVPILKIPPFHLSRLRPRRCRYQRRRRHLYYYQTWMGGRSWNFQAQLSSCAG